MKNTQNKPAAEESTSVRLDKWLWAARFFKTRTLSQDNIELGRIRMNGVRPVSYTHLTLPTTPYV